MKESQMLWFRRLEPQDVAIWHLNFEKFETARPSKAGSG
jgi:hypothetical protein